MEGPITPGPFLGNSDAIARVLELIKRAALVDVPVLLTGETGTGKSHLARLLHSLSARHLGPFLSVNCAGFPEGLFESELFGHRKGAFTGAVDSRAGLFEEASGGTLFLDEVGELPLSQQVKLLTVLEEKQVRRVGGARPRGVDVRIVAATSRELSTEVQAGAFRGDLYHRIALLRCELPPLRAHPDDLELLANHLLMGLARKYRRPGLTLSGPARAVLFEHGWPGNVRELAHALEAATILAPTHTIGADDLRGLIGLGGAVSVAPPTGRPDTGQGQRYSFFGSTEEERRAIHEALGRCRGNRTRAARELGMSRNTLRAKLRRLGLEPALPR